MRPQDIKVGQFYRLKDTPDYGYVKALKVLRPKEGENTKTYTVVKCEHTVYKGDLLYFIRFFRPCDMVKEG